MSTTAAAPAAAAPFHLDVSGVAPTPISRLVRVELRKAVDTRAGRWFAIAILALVLLVVAVGAAAFPEDAQTHTQMLGLAGGVLGYFLPVLVVLLITSEWSQRTGLATFTLEPRRSRVVGAKLIASLVLAVVTMVLAAALATLGTAASGINGGSVVWDLSWEPIQGFVLTSLIGVLVGFMLGLLLRNSPAAIVGYFVYTLILPVVAATLTALVSWFGDVAPWVEFNTAQTPLISGDYRASGQEWAQIAVTGVVWLVIPFVVALFRLRRSEVK